jgi:2-oxoisovalerate dehydrogenase E1 component alpha subunit
MPIRVHFPGAVNSKFTTDLNFVRPAEMGAMPTYRILNQDGVIVDKDREPLDVTEEEALKMYKDMLTGVLFLLRQYPVKC